MRFVHIDSIKEGMKLAKPLLGKNDELLLNKGVVLFSSYVSKIKQQGYNGIYIEDELSKEIEIPDIIDEKIRFEAVRSVKNVFLNIEEGKGIPRHIYRSLTDIIDNIVDSILENKAALVNIIDLKAFDNYTFYHCVNVCILSIVIGKAFDLNKKQLYNLGMTAILHDIGKTFIHKEILNKNEKLSDGEFEIIKTHSLKGYCYVKDNFDVPAVSYVGILQHHEKYDGSGYPMGIEGEKISLFGRIVSVSDVYDAITSDRPYRKALPSFEAIEYIMGNSGIAFDPAITKVFTQKIAPYPVGTSVCLSNNMTGLVVENYQDCCTRPKLKIFMHGDKEVAPYYIDLKNDCNSLRIVITGTATTPGP